LHLYRSLSADATMWRQRLDVTSNWAVPLIVAVTTFVLGEPGIPHLVLLGLGWALILVAVVIEARRFREVHHAEWRVHLLEVGYFARLLASEDRNDTRWQRQLAQDLAKPVPSLGMGRAMRLRMRNTYLVIAYLLLLAWAAKVVIHPSPTGEVDRLLDRLAVGAGAPGWVTLLVVAAIYGSMTAATLAARARPANETAPPKAPGWLSGREG
jgi:uncharacterized membrane protein